METHIPALNFDSTISCIFIAFCILMVALLASSEAAILAINKIRVKHLAKQGNKNALAIMELIKKPEQLFATILATENMFIIVGSSVGTASAISYFGPQSTILVSLILTILIVIFGEITPKTYAANNADVYALIVAKPLLFLVNALRPVILFFTYSTKSILHLLQKIGISSKHKQKHFHLTEEEIRMMINEGTFSHEEKKLLENIFEFSDTVVGEIMIPRTRIKALHINTSIKSALARIAEIGYSRFPVYEQSLDDIEGILYIKDIINALALKTGTEEDLIKFFIRPTIFIPENKKISELLRLMQKKHTYMAIIADEYGGTEGLITAEDILEEIVGEIEDETSPIKRRTDVLITVSDKSTIIVKGDTTIFDVNNQIKRPLPYGDYQTIAGFILYYLKGIPHQGQKIIFDNMEIIVTKIISPKIQEVKIVDLE